MNIIVSVASYNSVDRINGFLFSLMNCILPPDTKVLILNTGEPVSINGLLGIEKDCEIIYSEVSPRKRLYSSIMAQKVSDAKLYSDDETMFVNIDDDYDFNSHALIFAKEVFENHPEVNYLSLLKGPGVIVPDEELVELCGLRFYKSS